MFDIKIFDAITMKEQTFQNINSIKLNPGEGLNGVKRSLLSLNKDYKKISFIEKVGNDLCITFEGGEIAIIENFFFSNNIFSFENDLVFQENFADDSPIYHLENINSLESGQYQFAKIDSIESFLSSSGSSLSPLVYSGLGAAVVTVVANKIINKNSKDDSLKIDKEDESFSQAQIQIIQEKLYDYVVNKEKKMDEQQFGISGTYQAVGDFIITIFFKDVQKGESIELGKVNILDIDQNKKTWFFRCSLIKDAVIELIQNKISTGDSNFNIVAEIQIKDHEFITSASSYKTIEKPTPEPKEPEPKEPEPKTKCR